MMGTLTSFLSRQRLCRNNGNAMFVILNEVKNLIKSTSYIAEILRLKPQNDIVTQSLKGEEVKVSFFLHRSQKLQTLKELFQKRANAEIPQMEYAFVDGYSAVGKLIEIEVTATLSKRVNDPIFTLW
ncbi:MAG: hypothetical protein HY694_06430 [Deltaproteobacteria bacterium]|nr:hypothetical protein [Deltaproteobacteria bacterium]